MALYGDEDYYPGENGKSTDDFYYDRTPDEDTIDRLVARRAKTLKVSPEQWAAPVGRNGNFATGALEHVDKVTVLPDPRPAPLPVDQAKANQITSAPSAVSRHEKEEWDYRTSAAIRLGADKAVHEQATKKG